MVDTLVSGASASRRVGSTPIMGTFKDEEDYINLPHLFSCVQNPFAMLSAIMSMSLLRASVLAHATCGARFIRSGWRIPI